MAAWLSSSVLVGSCYQPIVLRMVGYDLSFKCLIDSFNL